MKTRGSIQLGMAVKGVILLLHLHVAVSATRPQVSVVAGYTAHIEACSAQIVDHRDIIGPQESSLGEIDCVRQCTRDVQCELAVYQELLDGPPFCTKLSAARNDASPILEVSSSRKCVAMIIDPCLNGGRLFEGVCLCQDGFTGLSCELANPLFCNVEWTETSTSNTNWTTALDSDTLKDFSHILPKIKFRDLTLNVVSVMKGMDSNRNTLSQGSIWFLVTYPFLEKASWNEFAPNPMRHYLYASSNGNGRYQRLTFNGSLNNYALESGNLTFDFISPRQSQFAVARNMPKDWTTIVEEMDNGFEMFRTTKVNIDVSNRVVVGELVGRFLDTWVAGDFVYPPQSFDFKYVLGQVNYRSMTFMGRGENGRLEEGVTRTTSYLNPCWTRMTDDKYDGRASLIGWKMLGTYLKLGHDVRVKVGPSYHTVIEVIQTGDLFTFVLAPVLSQGDSRAFIDPPNGVRGLISSSAVYQSCTYQIEREEVVDSSTTNSQYNVTWFVDAQRKWRNVFAVSSNSSVLHGSVADLISGVTKGCDVRIWIKWLHSDHSRFLDTQMSSVTDDGKVSTESLMTWKTKQDTTVVLSALCDIEYILVTSEGRVEVVTFNVWTPGKSEVLNDVMITWFLA